MTARPSTPADAGEARWTKRQVADYFGFKSTRTVDRMPALAALRIPVPVTGDRAMVRWDPMQVRALWEKMKAAAQGTNEQSRARTLRRAA